MISTSNFPISKGEKPATPNLTYIAVSSYIYFEFNHFYVNGYVLESSKIF